MIKDCTKTSAVIDEKACRKKRKEGRSDEWLIFNQAQKVHQVLSLFL